MGDCLDLWWVPSLLSNCHYSRRIKYVHQMWKKHDQLAVLSMQMTLTAIKGSILCVRLSTHWAALMVLFYQYPGLGCNWIQVGVQRTDTCDSKINRRLKYKNEELHTDRRSWGGIFFSTHIHTYLCFRPTSESNSGSLCVCVQWEACRIPRRPPSPGWRREGEAMGRWWWGGQR